MSARRQAVTGAFGYSGRYIARRLLARGDEVITLTGNPGRTSPFGSRVRAFPFDFERPAALSEHLRGVDTLYNTYWVRFNYGRVTYESAVANTQALLQAAVMAGVRQIVHLSITNADPASPWPYFRGKGLIEAAIRASGLSYAILRPAVIFGREDILINNIAWLLRRFPLFAVPGHGAYRLQPVFVEDLAELAVSAGAGSDNRIGDATGPETFTFLELVHLLAGIVGRPARIVHLPPGLVAILARGLGRMVGDVLLTRDEIGGLMAGLLATGSPPAGTTGLRAWLAENAASVGQAYASELQRHYPSA